MNLIPLPVVLPLLAAAFLLGADKILPKRAPDLLALVVAVAVAVVCAMLAARSWDTPLTYWFGGWQPQGRLALGIAFVVDPLGASVALLAAILFIGSFVFGWAFFDDVGTRFHVLMLVFLAAMTGFCLTGDLFNFFVFFELMSVAAFALTGYKLEASSLEGALNFTVINSIGSFLMLSGIGLIYARTSALNLAQIGEALSAGPPDALVAMACLLVLAALLIKGAILPFHFWLTEAHAVAPTPVCVIFSGMMVPIALFGIARLGWALFVPAGVLGGLQTDVLLYAGTVTAVVGGATSLMQRHVKRLLAFSTISHMGILLVGVAMLTRPALSGMLLYLLGHSLVKAALFMGAGILMSKCQNVDEIELRGKARHLPLTGVAFALGGLLLAGLPLGAMELGKHDIDAAAGMRHAWIPFALALGSALTGAAVLRATGRIFLGLGPDPGEESQSPGKPEHEKANRPMWLMLLPAAVFLTFALLVGMHDLTPLAEHLASHLAAGGPPSAAGIEIHAVAPPTGATEIPGKLLPWASVALALLIAAFELFRDDIPKALTAAVQAIFGPIFLALDRIHSGHIGDYAAWMMIGLAGLGVAFAF
ncbi:multisubunit sodium/proton antiporter, MrpD subunit [Faunimonas pinastri]|uniref:Multisubunit sodium/proton antiporter, MrpD subunit n=1 Tax=Faunimonas pinastri TaxID=1855383 RepID=A0A1H9LFD6_9HYPH|nr:proton-conducting transporter membrane subunit [Faunimonas pinastri]SER10201.1 multisubunit sodium/proton antiporter, MrpD subunit [Faunimonas pinastri]